MNHTTDTHATGNDDLAVADAVGVTRPFTTTDSGIQVPAVRPTSVVDEHHTNPVASARAIALALGVEQGSDVRVDQLPTAFIVVGLSRTAGPYNAVLTRDEHSAWVTAADLIRGGQGARVDALPLL